MKTLTALASLGLFPFVLSCSLDLVSGVQGSGNVMEELRDVGAFDSIRVGGSVDVYLSQGEPAPLKIVAEDNLIPLVESALDGSTLTIGVSGSYSTRIGIDVFVTAPGISSIETSGSCDVLVEGRLESEEISIRTSGSSDVECAVQAGSLNLKSSGSSDILVSGTADTLVVIATGSSDVSAYELVAIDAQVETSGSADALVNARNLEARAGGSSDIRYRGLPEKLNTSDSGSASIGPEGN